MVVQVDALCFQVVPPRRGVGLRGVERPLQSGERVDGADEAGGLQVGAVGGRQQHGEALRDSCRPGTRRQREDGGQAVGKCGGAEGGDAGVVGVLVEAIVDGGQGLCQAGGGRQERDRVATLCGPAVLAVRQSDAAIDEGVECGGDVSETMIDRDAPQTNDDSVEVRRGQGAQGKVRGELAGGAGHGASGWARLRDWRGSRRPFTRRARRPWRTGGHLAGRGGTAGEAGRRSIGGRRELPRVKVQHGRCGRSGCGPQCASSGVGVRLGGSIAVLFAASGCGGLFMPVQAPVGDAVPVVGAPSALHRLTELQLNRSLADLFHSPSLPRVALPEDVAVHGFTNHAATRDPGPYLVESLQADLSAVARQAVVDHPAWMSCSLDTASDPEGCAAAGIRDLLPRAWRRPLTDDEESLVVDVFESYAAELGVETGLELVLSFILQAPDFLYLIEHGAPSPATGAVVPLTDWEVASRLSYLVWGSVPDDTLRERAAAGDLRTAAAVRAEVTRMLADPRADTARLQFFQQWLGRSLSADLAPSYAHTAEAVLSEEEFTELDDIRAEGSPDAL